MNGTTITPVGVNFGAASVYEVDTPEISRTGPLLRIPAMTAMEFELEVDSSDLFGDEEKTDIYAKIICGMVTVSHMEISLETLAQITGEEFGSSELEAGVLIEPSKPPFIRLISYSECGGQDGESFTQELVKAKVKAVSIKFASKTYAEIELSLVGILPRNQPLQRGLARMRWHEQASEPRNFTSLRATKQALPIWDPDDTSMGYATVGGLRRFPLTGFVVGSFVEFSRYLASGTHTLSALTVNSAISGIVTVFVDDNNVGEFDLYESSTILNSLHSVSFFVQEGGVKTLRLQTTGRNPASNSFRVNFHDIYIDSPMVEQINILPINVDEYMGIPAFCYSESEGEPSLVFIPTRSGEQVEQTGQGDSLSYRSYLPAGEYRLSAHLGSGPDFATVTAYANGLALGNSERHATTTGNPSRVDFSNSFTLSVPTLVEIVLMSSGSIAASSGFRKSVAWVAVERVGGAGTEDDASPPGLFLPPWTAELVGYSGSVDTSQVQLFKYSTSSPEGSLRWDSVPMARGQYQATVIGTSGDYGALALRVGGEEVGLADFSEPGGENSKKVIPFEVSDTGFFEVSLEKTSGANSEVNYIWIERIN